MRVRDEGVEVDRGGLRDSTSSTTASFIRDLDAPPDLSLSPMTECGASGVALLRFVCCDC